MAKLGLSATESEIALSHQLSFGGAASRDSCRRRNSAIAASINGISVSE